ncbi:MAG: outer membrane lipid asymmetry maintenance protein MlaD [Deltaproteobacteria bacterium]|nr:outer membrane lipid asymmetry maintenance protein MlaD [Deltaproteobacteria bacterium]
MKRFSLEMAVGMFLVAGFLCVAYLSIKLGNLNLFNDNTYTVEADFTTVSGLKAGAAVEIAGVRIGRVASITLDPDSYRAHIKMAIQPGVQIQEDSIASIRTSGIIGDKYVNISPGGAPELIQPGGKISETESAVILEELLSKYIFEKQ